MSERLDATGGGLTVRARGASRSRPAPSTDPRRALGEAIGRASRALLALQASDGHFRFELEADCTIPSEYVLMTHFLGDIDASLEGKLATYVRDRQGSAGGWSLYPGGPIDLSCTVKAYWALKLAGDDPASPHMTAARNAILERGGAVRANVFTRLAMALFGEVPWRTTPFVPVEMVLLPRWFPFHLSKVSYWSRTVMVPLSILCSLRARAKNPRGVRIAELFVKPPTNERDLFPIRSRLNRLYLAMERTARVFEPIIPGAVRREAIRRAEKWMLDRLNGEHGLGGIFPAMVNALESLAVLGYPAEHPARVRALAAVRRLVVEREEDAYCQPCLSPVWDTALSALALVEARSVEPSAAIDAGIDGAATWLASKQILDGPGDWRERLPDLAPGGFAFQYENAHYPDLDDTSAAAWALHAAGPSRYRRPTRAAADWIAGMQSRCGGFGSFDADNTHAHLSHIPFADHGALLDPPTADVSARCATILARLDRAEDRASLRAALDFVFSAQEANGSWFGRWGTNYIYGTWSVLMALEAVEDPRRGAAVARAVEFLKGAQRDDGSWGETNESYDDPALAGRADRGTSFQTAWALLGLMAAGEAASSAVRRGVEFLLARQRPDGLWEDVEFTAPGFPRVFFLKYHGYSRYFPLWALARYRRSLARGRRRP